MKHEINQDLRSFNTFGLPSVASKYSEVKHAEDLIGLSNLDDLFVLGGGSNILLPSVLDKWVIHNNINYIHADAVDENDVIVKVGAGVNWHHLVKTCVKLGWAGIENLALIPGRVGAAPVQNIGAYGVELKDVFIQLTAYDLETKAFVEMDRKHCAFGYRSSIFKTTEKGRYIITSVQLKLSKSADKLNLEYYALKDECQRRNISNPTIQDVFNLVISIRSSKLPNPDELGNSGSFFKNPVIDEKEFKLLKIKFPTIKYFEMESGYYKIPAGYLIEQCGWKGRRVGNTGCYEKQALVIVNYGDATSEEVVALVTEIKTSVRNTFGITLQEEVNIIQ